MKDFIKESHKLLRKYSIENKDKNWDMAGKNYFIMLYNEMNHFMTQD